MMENMSVKHRKEMQSITQTQIDIQETKISIQSIYSRQNHCADRIPDIGHKFTVVIMEKKGKFLKKSRDNQKSIHQVLVFAKKSNKID